MNHGENIGRFTQAGKHHFVPKKQNGFPFLGPVFTSVFPRICTSQTGGKTDVKTAVMMI